MRHCTIRFIVLKICERYYLYVEIADGAHTNTHVIGQDGI